jgi:hypothetical protein
MPLSHSLPNPLARLTRVIAAFEEARRAGGQLPADPHGHGSVRVDHDADLDGLSLSCRAVDPRRQEVPLDWVSMMSATPTREPCQPDELRSASLSLPDNPPTGD